MKITRREGGFSRGKDGRSIGAREQDDSAQAPNKLNILNCRLRVCLQSWQNRGAKLRILVFDVERALRYRAPMGALLLALRHTNWLAATERGDRHSHITQAIIATLDAVKIKDLLVTEDGG